MPSITVYATSAHAFKILLNAIVNVTFSKGLIDMPLPLNICDLISLPNWFTKTNSVPRTMENRKSALKLSVPVRSKHTHCNVLKEPT